MRALHRETEASEISRHLTAEDIILDYTQNR
jgi:hypothetical protein